MASIDSLSTNILATQLQSKVLSVIKKFPEKEVNSKKEKKRIKLIYDEIHKIFLKKYVLDSYFNDMFKDGTYNCVTATALYTYVFDELNIPYHIKETPSHVFLVAYPNSHKIYLETTVPGAYGFSVPVESEVIKIVDELMAYKLVTKDEVLAKGYMKFYEDYFYGNEFIDKSSLIGMQYYNKGLFYFQNEDFDNAINNLRKSKVFYSSPLINPILKEIMFLKVNDLEFNKLEDIDFLIELLSIAKYPEDYSISNLKSSLYKIIEHDDNDIEFIESSLVKIRKIKNDKVKETALEFLYEYLAKQAVTDEDLDKGLKYCDEILAVNPKSKFAEQIIEYVVFKKVLFSTYDMETLNEFEKICNKYEFLRDNNRYSISLVHLYGNISLTNIKNNNIDKGITYLNKMEYLLDNNNVLDQINKSLLSELYNKAGNYYYYKEQHKSSYKIYMKGLTYLPNDVDLKKRAKWSKEEF
ncbi:MAG: hypothetical protein R2785_08740 [Flavobacteriaceae bacterium]